MTPRGLGRAGTRSGRRALALAVAFAGLAVTLSDGSRILASDLQLRSDAPAASVGATAGGALASAALASHDLEGQMEDMERRAIVEALEKSRYNKTKAAALLGMSFRSLRYRIKKLNIE